MKVLLVNGSPHKDGCTYTALSEVKKELDKENIETEIFHVGSKPISGCLGCGTCAKINKCVIDDDTVNECLEKAKSADGFVFGSPVHFAAASGAINSFMDRLFYAGSRFMAQKPGAALDNLNKYLGFAQMPIVSSRYWNMVHGNSPDEVRQDREGMQVMRCLGQNMAWLLKCIEAGSAAGINKPDPEKKERTNFIR